MILRWLSAGTFLATTLASASASAVASAELYFTQSYLYGRYEARIRYAGGDGVISSFFLWKVGSETAGAYWNELDFEKLGADCRMQSNALYGVPLNSSEQSHTMPSDMCDAYHDYSLEWTPTYLAWFIDGQEIRRDTGAIAAAFAENASSGMRIHFNVWPGNANFGGNFNPAILPVRQYISWVQYSSYQDGAFTFEWREEFDGPNLPSGWATGNWDSPYGLSTHNPANVSLVNGIAVVSLTADDATGFTGVPPDDTGGAGGAGGSNAGGSTASGAGGTSASGVGGASASGGAATADAASGGFATGGVTTSSGGSGAGGAGQAAGAAPGEPAAPSADAGCGCRVAGDSTGRFGTGALLLGVMALLRRRRR
jgi:MYXO-CTERM domain-containing protein